MQPIVSRSQSDTAKIDINAARNAQGRRYSESEKRASRYKRRDIAADGKRSFKFNDRIFFNWPIPYHGGTDT